MKSLIILNIGLETTKQTRVDVHHALGAVIACGVSITTSAVVNGEWDGKPEPCLFIQGFVADPLSVSFRAQLYLASRLLSQHVIALYSDGRGELIGDNPEGWKFDSELFHFHPEKRVRLDVGALPCQYSECQAIQAETAERIAARVAEYTAEDAKRHEILAGHLRKDEKHRFCEYIESTLIPDLKESGLEATASDFGTAVVMIRDGI